MQHSTVIGTTWPWMSGKDSIKGSPVISGPVRHSQEQDGKRELFCDCYSWSHQLLRACIQSLSLHEFSQERRKDTWGCQQSWNQRSQAFRVWSLHWPPPLLRQKTQRGRGPAEPEMRHSPSATTIPTELFLKPLISLLSDSHGQVNSPLQASVVHLRKGGNSPKKVLCRKKLTQVKHLTHAWHLTATQLTVATAINYFF